MPISLYLLIPVTLVGRQIPTLKMASLTPFTYAGVPFPVSTTQLVSLEHLWIGLDHSGLPTGVIGGSPHGHPETCVEREQNKACLSYAEHEQVRQRQLISGAATELKRLFIFHVKRPHNSDLY